MNFSPTLYIVSGPDRVGKSTYISSHAKPEDSRFHFGPVPPDASSLLRYHQSPVLEWLKTNALNDCWFDRSYVCTFLLNTMRHGHQDCLDEIVEYEILLHELADKHQFKVQHIGITRPWNVCAPLHLEELRAQNPDWSLRAIRNEYIRRMKEHERYLRELQQFYHQITIFPSTFA